jgi:FMN phosphatase YigB (HAD superfamily)
MAHVVSLSQPKIVFFDIGNIFMTFDKIFTRVTREFSLQPDQFSDFEDLFDKDANLGKINIPDVWEKFITKHHIKNASNYNLISSWVSDYEPILSVHILTEKIVKKYQVGIISNYYRGFFEECLSQKFIPNLPFNPVIISAEIGVMKPDRSIYEIAQTKSGFLGNELFYIDDKVENLSIPQSLGWQTFQFDYHQPDSSCEEIAKILKI